MKNKHDHKSDNRSLDGGIGKDLQEGSKRKDLFYLNDLVQTGGYDALKGGESPRKQKQSMQKKDNSMADES